MDPFTLGGLAFEAFRLLVGGATAAVSATATPPTEPPGQALVVHEVRSATDAEIAAAALEVPELMRRAEEAAERNRINP